MPYTSPHLYTIQSNPIFWHPSLNVCGEGNFLNIVSCSLVPCCWAISPLDFDRGWSHIWDVCRKAFKLSYIQFLLRFATDMQISKLTVLFRHWLASVGAKKDVDKIYIILKTIIGVYFKYQCPLYRARCKMQNGFANIDLSAHFPILAYIQQDFLVLSCQWRI